MDLVPSITDGRMVVFQWGVVIGASLVAAAGDLRTGRIPNALTMPLLAVGLVWATWLGGLSGLAVSAGMCVLLALPYVLLFVFAHGGAGDAKLMGAIGAWLGLREGLTVLLCVASAGVLLAVAKAMAQKRTKSVLTSVLVWVYSFALSLKAGTTLRHESDVTDDELSDSLDFPYGVAILTGVCVAAGIVGIWGVEWLW